MLRNWLKIKKYIINPNEDQSADLRHAKGVRCHWANKAYLTISENLRNYILIASKIIFHFVKPILGISFRVFVIFSKISCEIWKIYLNMFSCTYILSKNHIRSLLNFFPIENLTLNWVKSMVFCHKI